ncbi:type IV toxin-antitoxin system AbiEi family antitoxin domain-containing protein [Solicola gregarius]|uniref:Type IV toxin-antitoxin system AbiEi family antitoxin domain-containing protein n=1 Tax=Solicola gregarius TaxID=2908642 RepID=A0AA46TK36_9ACTN|nr:type IV toxin-antitoxin system AbiEi family antitoxin domain-containing protein [Solicola gregarius]UYM05903.1 type IV toxin-antitoxin system AbiEi family antitoxin domain-containing protein [Solicola gregarius]
MDVLTAIAESNGGYFRTYQALEAGYHPRDIRRALRTNVVRRIRHGTYAFAETWDHLHPEGRHVVLTNAVVRESGGAVAACSVSACALRGMSLWGHDLSQVHVVRLDGGASRREAGVVHHRASIDESDIEVVDGVPSVKAPRAVCEAATTASLEAGIVLFDSALRLGATDEESLDRQAAAMEHCPGTRQVRFGILLADGRAESPGESRNRFLFFRFNIPAPDLQVKIRASDGVLIGITDFAWDLYCHVGEFDGLIKYRRDAFGDRAPEQVVTDEKVREDAIRAEHKGMTRTIWGELESQVARRTANRTKADLERSRTLYTRNRVTIV